MTTGKTSLTSLTRKELDKKKLSERRQRKLPADSLERINKAKQIWEHVRRWVWSINNYVGVVILLLIVI